jgi:hypothetical protein
MNRGLQLKAERERERERRGLMYIRSLPVGAVDGLNGGQATVEPEERALTHAL